MATTQDYINQLKIDKQNLVSMLNNMGVEANENETFTALAPKVGKIVADPILQDKAITITENGTQTITADSGYNGLNKVDITTNIQTGGNTPTVGFIVNKWTNTGYPKEITFVGMSKINNYYFRNTSGTTSDWGAYLEKVTLNAGITSIGNSSFYNTTNLKEINLDNVVTFYANAFYGCRNLVVKTLKKAQTIMFNAFQNNTSLTQMSLPSFVDMQSGSQSPWKGCSNLKALWIGDKVSNALNECTFRDTYLTKIFINLPRATVEAMTYYSLLWRAPSTCQIICNDDAGWMTQEEFDAIDWATYTG